MLDKVDLDYKLQIWFYKSTQVLTIAQNPLQT